MFSGIIEELGQIRSFSRRGNVTLIEIAADKVLEGTKIGDSIAVNGTCFTVVKVGVDSLSFEAMSQTLKTTNLGSAKAADKVNLERSLKVGDRISGHFVTGHVDCLGVIRSKRLVAGNLSFEVAIPARFLKFCLAKGSIAVDGISLTLVNKKSNVVSVYIIPHTFKHTTLSFKGPSYPVNIEFDVLVKAHVSP